MVHDAADRGCLLRPAKNQITFPAAILQPPFFDPNADAAVNYGAIGADHRHEIGHGFDDQGREFDGSGKVRNWWSTETNANFVEATKKLGAQYGAYCPLEGACVNGDLTMGENIGDLGGLEMAYTAYQLSLVARKHRCSMASPAISASSCPSRKPGAARRATTRYARRC
jgi:predicted metalloendopeptidase